jgi:hypothetical protein
MHSILLLGIPDRRLRRNLDDEELYARSSEISARFLIGKKRISYRASVTYRPNEQTRDEVVGLTEKWNFKDIDGKSRWVTSEELGLFVADNSVHFRVPRGYVITKSMGHSVRKVFSRRGLEGRLPSESTLRAFEQVQQFRQGISYYSASQFTNPGLCPTSFNVDKEGDLQYSPGVQRRGLHTRFIFEFYRLWRDNKVSYQQYLSLVDQTGLGLVNKIHWREVKFVSPAYEVRAGGRVVSKRETTTMIIPIVHVGDSQLSFSQLSEGTLRTLALLFYVVTDKSALLLIEEPEVCVHHGLLKSLIEIIKEYARTKQIIFSTHSEAVVDSLEPEQVLLVDKSKTRGSVVASISQKMSLRGMEALKNYLSTSGTLGEYWRHQGFAK